MQQVRGHGSFEFRGGLSRFPQVAATASRRHGASRRHPPPVLFDPTDDLTFAMTGLPVDFGLDFLSREKGQGRAQQ